MTVYDTSFGIELSHEIVRLRRHTTPKSPHPSPQEVKVDTQFSDL